MNTPMPTDHEIAAELEAMLLAEAERITPEPALHQILARAHEAERPRVERRRRRWLPALAGAVATVGITAAAIVVFAPGDDPTKPAEPPPCAVELREGCPVDLAVYWSRPSVEELISAGVTVSSTGNVGIDAVQALLDAESRPAAEVVNFWHGYSTSGRDSGPIAKVNDVTHSDGIITIDFDRQLTTGQTSLEGEPTFGEPIIQQLVLTTQSALRTDDPVLITINGEPAEEAFGTPLPDAVDADRSLVSVIRPETPAQGETVSSPVTISGTSDTFEANVLWEVTQAGEIVDDGFTSGGTLGAYARFEITVNLEPGDYTVNLWAPNEASVPEAWAAELSVVYIDFTVE